MTKQEGKLSVKRQDFSPRLLSVVKHPPPPLPRVLLWVMLVLVTLLLILAVNGRLDIVARAEGSLIPQTRLKIVQPLEDGRIARLLVSEGEQVKQGQLLALMDDELNQGSIQRLDGELRLARMHLRRVEAELVGEPPTQIEGEDSVHFSRLQDEYLNNRAAHEQEKRELNANMERVGQELLAAKERVHMLEESLPLYLEEEEAFIKLAKAGYSDKIARIERQRERIEAQQELQAQNYQVDALRARVKESGARLRALDAKYRRSLYEQLDQLETKIAALEKELADEQYRNRLLRLTAPADGIVKELSATTEGAVIPAGNVLMSLVPSDEPLKAEVMVSHRDVGFVKKGQEARIKLTSYEFQRFGVLEAVVEQVSPDALQSSKDGQLDHGQGYRVLLNLERQYLESGARHFELRSGMQVSAELRLGTRSVLEYLLSPIVKGISSAGQER
jgi:hemolysin D